jgi:hypothetical protein
MVGSFLGVIGVEKRMNVLEQHKLTSTKFDNTG